MPMRMLMLQIKQKKTPLNFAAQYGHTEIVESLLKADANADAADDTKMTPLHHAAWRGHVEIVENLLKAGANVNAKCDSGYTPLYYSNLYCHHEVSECLLEYGANEHVWNRFVRYVSSAFAIKTASHTQSTKTVHVSRKSTDGVSRHSEYSHTSIMTCEPRDGDIDVTPSTVFANDIQQASSSAACVTLSPSGRTANYCTVISDDTEATTSALPQGLSIQECDDIRKQVEDHWAKFRLINKSNSGQCSTDVTSMLKDGNITVNVSQTIHVSTAKFVNMNSRVNFIQTTEPTDSDAETDVNLTNDNGSEGSNEEFK
ncbi:hypothetical protein BsWGS_26208 [Bradybaena similaris]